MRERKVYEPGIYNITNEEYHNAAGISRSGIMEFRRSPKHFWHRYINPNYLKPEPTDAMDFGTAFHAYILERHKFRDQFYIAEKNPYHHATKAGIAFKKSILEDSKGKKILKSEDFDKILDMTLSLHSHEQAKNLVTIAQYELSIFWIDDETGLLCKARPDILQEKFVVDLKTTKCANLREFQRDFYNDGYHIQISMIAEGLRKVKNKELEGFIDLAIEKTEPYCTAIYPIDDSVVTFGLEEFKRTLKQIKICLDTQTYPSYPSQILTLPAWAKLGE